MGLFGPGWKSRNENRALLCIQKEQDEFELMNAVHFAPLPKVRLYAAEKIKNINNLILLYWQPKTDDSLNEYLRGRLHNHPELVSVALQSKDVIFRDVALLMMDDETLLLKVIQEAKDPEYITAAAQKLHSSDALKEAAKYNVWAAEKLTDEKDAFLLLKKTKKPEIASVLFSRIIDQKLSGILTSEACLRETRTFFAKQLSDTDVITKTLLHLSDNNIANILLPKINNEEKYRFLAWNADWNYVYNGAASYITDEEELGKLAVSRKMYRLVDSIHDDNVLRWMEANTDDARFKNIIYEKQGIYICSTCGRKTSAASCICKFCGVENHSYKHKSDLTEYRDYATGREWEECSRCGKIINEKSVYHEYLE